MTEGDPLLRAGPPQPGNEPRGPARQTPSHPWPESWEAAGANRHGGSDCRQSKKAATAGVQSRVTRGHRAAKDPRLPGSRRGRRWENTRALAYSPPRGRALWTQLFLPANLLGPFVKLVLLVQKGSSSGSRPRADTDTDGGGTCAPWRDTCMWRRTCMLTLLPHHTCSHMILVWSHDLTSRKPQA